MALVEVTVDTAQLERLVKKYGDSARQISPSIIGTGLLRAIDDEFQSEGGGNWQGFSSVTTRIHNRGGGRLLQDTGQLANIQVMQEGPNFVQVGSPAPYAGVHITGTTQTNVFNRYNTDRMPLAKRDFLAIDLGHVLEEAADAIAAEIVTR